MASLSQKRGIWYLWITINGRRKGISLGTKSRMLAEVLAQNIQEHEQEEENDGSIKLNNLINLWKSWHSHFSPHYISTVELMMKLFIRYVGDISIKDISPEVLVHYYRGLKKLNYSDSYVHNRLKSLRTLFNWAIKKNLLSISLFTSQVYIPKETSRIEFLSKKEIKILVKTANENPLHQAYIEFLLSTGVRRGEFFNLKWSDINEHYIEFYGKTGRRIFPINSQIKSILKKIKNNYKGSSDFVFIDIKTGERPKLAETLGSVVKKYILKAGLKRTYTTHTLRHTFASHLVLNGVPIYTVSKLLGHSNVKTTERYAHLSPELINTPIKYF